MSSTESSEDPGFVLQVDGGGLIRHVNEAWLRFGRENQLGDRPLLGRGLFEFITDLPTQQLYQSLLEHVRRSGRPVRFAFRCDSPSLRRFMEMQMSLLPKDGVEFRSRLLRTEARKPVSLLDPTVPRSPQLIRMCAWCKQVAVPDWVEVECALARTGWFEHATLPQVSHGICPLMRRTHERQPKCLPCEVTCGCSKSVPIRLIDDKLSRPYGIRSCHWP